MPSLSSRRLLAMLAPWALAAAAPLTAQSDQIMTLGDVVRIDGEFIGTLMSIDDGTTLVILGQGEQTCWPGMAYGEGPRCDPAPTVRRVVDWADVKVERHANRGYTGSVIVGFLVGAAVAAPIGYFTGPSLGYGEIDACYQGGLSVFCGNPIPRSEYDALQRTQDQKRGAFFFGLMGGTLGAILGRHFVSQWVVVDPPTATASSGAWSLGVTLPTGAR